MLSKLHVPNSTMKSHTKCNTKEISQSVLLENFVVRLYLKLEDGVMKLLVTQVAQTQCVQQDNEKSHKV